jgi:hypothetical protein
MNLKKRDDGWWIVNVPDTITECGPYDTKAEAKDDMDGLQRTFDALDRGDKRIFASESNRL